MLVLYKVSYCNYQFQFIYFQILLLIETVVQPSYSLNSRSSSVEYLNRQNRIYLICHRTCSTIAIQFQPIVCIPTGILMHVYPEGKLNLYNTSGAIFISILVLI